jgi:tetratricopeptide (TPR) repeat protein
MNNFEKDQNQESFDLENESLFADEDDPVPIMDHLFLDTYDKKIVVSVENCIWHGLDCIDCGQYDEAIQIFNKGLEFDKDITDFWLFKAICYKKMQNPIDTQGSLEKINWDLFFIHAQRLYRKLQFKKALRYFEKGIELNPSDPDLWDNKGSCLEQLGKIDAALDCYQHAKELDRLSQPNF